MQNTDEIRLSFTVKEYNKQKQDKDAKDEEEEKLNEKWMNADYPFESILDERKENDNTPLTDEYSPPMMEKFHSHQDHGSKNLAFFKTTQEGQDGEDGEETKGDLVDYSKCRLEGSNSTMVMKKHPSEEKRKIHHQKSNSSSSCAKS